MKKLNYYTATCVSTWEDGKVFSMAVMGKDFTKRFKSLEDVKREIQRDLTCRQRKDMTRTYSDGTKVRLSFNDINDIKYIIEKHYEEVEEINIIESPRKYKESKEIKEEEISI